VGELLGKPVESARGPERSSLQELLAAYVGQGRFDGLYEAICRMVPETCRKFAARYSPTGCWDAEAYRDIAHQVCIKLLTPRGAGANVLYQYFQEGRNDAGIRKGIEVITRNILWDEARKRNPEYALIRRKIGEILRQSDEFGLVQFPGSSLRAWGLRQWSDTELFRGTRDELVTRIETVAVARDDLVSLLREILSGVGALLSLDMLCVAVCVKSGIQKPAVWPIQPDRGEGGTSRGPEGRLVARDIPADIRTVARVEVDRFLSGLTPVERAVFRGYFVEEKAWTEILADAKKEGFDGVLRTLERKRDGLRDAWAEVVGGDDERLYLDEASNWFRDRHRERGG
jgi:hypothetical protein